MTSWISPTPNLELSPHHVDVWRVRLASTDQDQSTLSTDECERASCFHFDKDRNRFIIAHSSLRDILARYLHCEPQQLSFSTNRYGKPFLPDHDIEFNLSHSGDYALIAVTRGRSVGVDVEQIRADVEIESLASRYFSQREISELMSLPVEQRTIGFFSCWTRKEAYIKAHGLGLSLPLDSFDVSLTPNKPVVLRATRPNPHEAAHWTILPLEIDSRYSGAVAVVGQSMEFRFWDWNAVSR